MGVVSDCVRIFDLWREWLALSLRGACLQSGVFWELVETKQRLLIFDVCNEKSLD